MITPGGSLLLHIGKPLGVGRSWLLPHGLLSVRRHERLGSVAVGLYRGEIHRYLSSHEGSGQHYLLIFLDIIYHIFLRKKKVKYLNQQESLNIFFILNASEDLSKHCHESLLILRHCRISSQI